MTKKFRFLSLALALVMLIHSMPVISVYAQEEGTSSPEITNPFSSSVSFSVEGETVTSNSFRIPAMVTLADGTILAAADIRWNTTYDGGGLDTLVARSTDGGATWSYVAANYLGDNGNVYNAQSTAFIDPSLLVAPDGKTVYLLTDLYPYGIALNGNGNQQLPSTEVGFNEDGYLLLSNDNHTTYDHYLKDGKIYDSNNTAVEGYTVDEYFNITGTDGTDSNLFFADSPFKVVRTGFLYLISSADGGATWSAPRLLDLKNNTENVCLASPGNGVTTKDGIMIFPVYSYRSDTQKMGFVFSKDNGATWQRSADFDGIWASESSVVEIGEGTLRFFFRNKTAKLCYVDYNMTENTWGTCVQTEIPTNSNTQLSAITYSETYYGKQVILVSCPTGPNSEGSDNNDGSYRTNGKIFVGAVEADGTMSWINTIDVSPVTATGQLDKPFTEDKGFFAYSCLTERSDGSVVIMYENHQNYWGAGDDRFFTLNTKLYSADEIGVPEESIATLPDGTVIRTTNTGENSISASVPESSALDEFELSEGLKGNAYEMTLLDKDGNSVTPDGKVSVSIADIALPEGHDSAIVLHFLHKDGDIPANGIYLFESDHSSLERERNAVEKVLGMTNMVAFEVLDATVANSKVTFETNGFSTYYVVTGEAETLKNWWETTQVSRYNLDTDVYGLDENDSGTREFVVEPNSSFYLYLKGNVTVNGQTAEGPVSGNWAYTDNSNGTMLFSTASDGLGKIVKASTGASGSITVTAKNWTVTIRVSEDGTVVDDVYDNASYPVYIGITLNATDISIGNEPRISGHDTNAWVYLTSLSDTGMSFSGHSGAFEQYKSITPVAGSVGASYLTEEIKTVSMLESTDSKHVKGIIDHTLDAAANGAIDITPYIQNINWGDIKTNLLIDSSISSQMIATDGVNVSSNPGAYELHPYVVKIQTGNFVGWHINACFVPTTNTSNEWIYFDENLNEALGQQVEYLNVPARIPYNGGNGRTMSMYTVDPKNPGSNYVKVSPTEYVTLTNGQKLQFVGWNTMPDGSGFQYTNEGMTFADSKDHEHPLVAGGTLYAFWDSTLDRLEIHKNLIIDEDSQSASRYKTDFKFNVTLTLPSDSDQPTVLAEIFDKASDNLLETKSYNVSNHAVSFELSFNEDEYAVVFAPEGTTYTVTETLPTGNDYTQISAVNTEGTIEGVGEGKDVIFTNGWNNTTGMLDISKDVVIPEGTEVENWQNQEFDFTVQFKNPETAQDQTFTYQKYDSQTKPIGDPITVDSTNVTFRLKHGERVIFTGLKQDTAYIVAESAVENYTVTMTKASGLIVANETQTVVVTNTHKEDNKLVSLTIKKVFPDGADYSMDVNQSFIFTVVSNTDGENVDLKVTIHADGSIIIDGLTAGNSYTITEITAWSWRYNNCTPFSALEGATVNGNSITVTLTDIAENNVVTFTNTRSEEKWLDGDSWCNNIFK